MFIKSISIKKDCAILEYDENKKLLIDPKLISVLNIKNGEEVTGALLLKENESFAYEYAMDAAAKYLSYSMRSEEQLKKHLGSKHLQLSCIDRVIEKLKDYKYIDDLSYSKIYTSDAASSKKGKAYIKNKLREKGVADENIVKALLIYSDEEAHVNARSFLEKKNVSLLKYPQQLRRDKLLRAALSQGYGISDASDIISDIFSAEEADDYEDYYAALINKKILILQNKELSNEAISKKIYAEFIPKGAKASIIKECLSLLK